MLSLQSNPIRVSILTAFIDIEVILIAELFWATGNEYIIFPKKVLKAADLVEIMLLLVILKLQTDAVCCGTF